MNNGKFPIASVISNYTKSGDNGLILGINGNRSHFCVQNLSTGVLYIALGTGLASNTYFNIVLKAATNSGDGTAGVYIEDRWKGAVTASGALNTSYIVWEAY
jgi:hypothetical protein